MSINTHVKKKELVEAFMTTMFQKVSLKHASKVPKNEGIRLKETVALPRSLGSGTKKINFIN